MRQDVNDRNRADRAGVWCCERSTSLSTQLSSWSPGSERLIVNRKHGFGQVATTAGEPADRKTA